MKAAKKTLIAVSLGLPLLGLSGLAHADNTSAQRVHARYVAAQAGHGGLTALAGGLIVSTSSTQTAVTARRDPHRPAVADCMASGNSATNAN